MEQIRLKDYGILPGQDVTLALHEVLQKFPHDTEFLFETGDYYFAPHPEMKADYRLSNTDVLPLRTLGIWLKHHKNCVLDGQGATLYFAGQMQPFTLDRCENVTVQNFTVDWEKPLVAEGTVVQAGRNFADVKIDPRVFPHRFAQGTLLFDVGAGEEYPLCKHSCIIYHRNSKTVVPHTGDCFFPKSFSDLGDSIYRFFAKDASKIHPGNLLVLRHNARQHAGFFAEKCKNMKAKNLTFHSCGGLGCLAQFCENLTFDSINFLPNTAVGRQVTNGRDDGFHLTCNKGHISITNCSFLGLMDDPVNVHGCCVTAEKALDKRTLLCRYRHGQAQNFLYWAEAGDEITFLKRDTMAPVGKATAAIYRLETPDTFTLHFAADLPEKLLLLAAKKEALALDNTTNTASFTCENNRFGSCRARGILVSTPKAVRIKNNVFASSGSAILVAGDSNEWFESGACHHVEITGNTFSEHCCTSFYQFCHGVISVCPVVPKPDINLPYHHHIRIAENTFDTPSVPPLYAFSCTDLVFEKNRIFHNPRSTKNLEKSMILSHCTGVKIAENHWIGFTDKPKILTENCLEIQNLDQGGL